jgi:Ca-activated chloride channel family protein
MKHRRLLLHRLGSWLGLLPVATTLLAFLTLNARPADEPGGPIELLFVYGSEKEAWVNDATGVFNDGKPVVEGRPIHVKAVPLGSGETVEDVLAGRQKAHLISPASGAYLELGNGMAGEKGEKDLVGAKRHNLVLSPVIIAMWKPMAEALGWPAKEIGWKELHDLAVSKSGWASVGHPEWGRFKFGHTHPERSNSGLIALFAQVYAATGKKSKLTVPDVQAPATSAFLKDLQRAVVHYGSSTGFFAKQMFSNDMEYLSAAVMCENLVIESYDAKVRSKLPAEVVAIYPKEGTFWSDHPVAVVERDWVTPLHRKAAEQYIAFLLRDDQQRKALKYGFRPGVDSVEIGAPIDKAHGADPSKPGSNVLRPPEVDVMNACLKAWTKNKKHARVALVFDKSESMIWEKGKLENAKEGAKEIVKHLSDEDSMALLVFNRKLFWVERGLKLKETGARERLLSDIDTIAARGGTALYDAIASAYQQLQSEPDPDMITAIVVLTDGQDEDSKMKLEELLRQIKVDNKTNVTRIYTIAYGAEADKKALKQIADITKAKAYEGKPDTIRVVVKDIATFF